MKILCGIKAIQALDIFLSKALQAHDVKFFSDIPADISFEHYTESFDKILTQLGSWTPELILCIEPFQRLLPKNFERTGIPLVTLCQPGISKLQGLAEAIPLFDAWIPATLTDRIYLETLTPAVTQTCWMGYDRDYYFPNPSISPLYDAIDMSHDEYSPCKPLYESLKNPPHYFTRTSDIRNAHFINQSRIVLMDNPQITRQHFEIMACGALLFCHENNQEIQSYVKPEQDFIYFNEGNLAEKWDYFIENEMERRRLTEHAIQTIKSFEYSQLLSKILTELQSMNLASAVAQRQNFFSIDSIEHQRSKLWFLISTGQADGLEMGRNILEKMPQKGNTFNWYANIYARGVSKQGIRNPPEQLFKIALSLLEQGQQAEQLPELLNRAWLHTQLQQYESSQKLFNQALKQVESTQAIDEPLLMLQEPFYQEVANREDALALTVQFMRGFCAIQLGHFEEAIEIFQQINRHHSSPLTSHEIAKLLLRENKTSEALQQYQDIWQHYPLHLQPLAEYIYHLQFHDREKALTLCHQGISLAQRYIPAMNAVEVFYSLERKLHPTAAKGCHQLHLFWEGAFYSNHSLAIINREILTQLQKNPDIQATLLNFEPPEFSPSTGGFGTHLHEGNLDAEPDVMVSHRWPPRWNGPQEGKWINIIPWEFGVLPAAWVPIINQGLDQVWVPTHFVQDSFMRSGVFPEKITVIPNGVDTHVFTPEGIAMNLQTEKKFRFLFVGGSIKRKGIDILLEAYCQAFSDRDDVSLVIKDFGTRTTYSTMSYYSDIQARMNAPHTPEILYLDTTSLTDEEMASLYRACQIYVHPYRGEGFGMPILEAMACGLSVMIPDQGACLDFCDPDFAWLIRSFVEFDKSKNVGGVGLSDYYPFWNTVDIQQLKQWMRTAYEQKKDNQQRGKKARERALQFDWNRICEQVKQTLLQMTITPLSYRDRQQKSTQTLSEGTQLVQKQQLESARQKFEQATQLAPDSLTAWSNLSITYLLLNQPKESLTHSKRAILAGQDFEATQAVLNQLASQAPHLQKILPKLPLTIYWKRHNSLLEDLPSQSSRFSFQEKPMPTGSQWVVSSDLQVTDINIYRLLTDNAKLPPHYETLWIPEFSIQETLEARGINPEAIDILPLSINFDRFSPQVSPLLLEESRDCYVFLSIFDWLYDDGWQTLLSAYINTFTPQEKVNLVFKPYGAPLEDIFDIVSQWLEKEGHDPENIPNLTFVSEDLRHDMLPAFYNGAQAFIGVNSSGNGIWHLAAQAAGLKTISTGHFSFLKNPYTQCIQPNDDDHLGWLMRKCQSSNNSLTGQAVREYLYPKHHSGIVNLTACKLLEKRILLTTIKEMERSL